MLDAVRRKETILCGFINEILGMKLKEFAVLNVKRILKRKI